MKRKRRRIARRSKRWPFEASSRGLGQLVDLAGRETGVTFRTELKFHAVRRWKFDFGCEQLGIAVEYEGGMFSRQGHTRPVRFRSDMEKYNEGQLARAGRFCASVPMKRAAARRSK